MTFGVTQPTGDEFRPGVPRGSQARVRYPGFFFRVAQQDHVLYPADWWQVIRGW